MPQYQIKLDRENIEEIIREHIKGKFTDERDRFNVSFDVKTIDLIGTRVTTFEGVTVTIWSEE